MIYSLDGIFWLLITLVPFIFVQRMLHREIQATLLLITRNQTVMIVLFSILFFPGVFMHEFSHFIMARLLFVRTGKFSLIPQTTVDGRVILGYVETAQSGILRDSIIGAAPLLSGCISVALIALNKLHFPLLVDLIQNGQFGLFGQAMLSVPEAADFWLWFYLAFVISSTMMPSALDRRAWLPLGLVVALLLAAALFLGAGSWMVETLAKPFNSLLMSLTLVFGCSLVLHAFLWIPFTITRRVISRLTGLRVS